MNSLMPPWPVALAFAAACLVLALTPGPGVMYIVTRSLVHGRQSGLASVAGVALGNLGNAIAACLGLAAVFEASPLAFVVVKFAGAAYLVYLGLRLLLASPAAKPLIEPAPASRLLRDGFLVALFNPKTAMFFAPFLPQFVTPGVAPLPQSLLLGASFVALAAVTDSGYALTASAVAPRLMRSNGLRRWGQLLGGATFVGLGIAVLR